MACHKEPPFNAAQVMWLEANAPAKVTVNVSGAFPTSRADRVWLGFHLGVGGAAGVAFCLSAIALASKLAHLVLA